MKIKYLFAVVFLTSSLAGCVTYVHNYKPGKPSLVCGNAMGCTRTY